MVDPGIGAFPSLLETGFPWVVHGFTFVFGVAGAALIIYGGLHAVWSLLFGEVTNRQGGYARIRRGFTDRIIFGLEFFIAADVLATVLAPSQEELIVLGMVVVIRTVLGYFLAREAREYPLMETKGE
ncbi:MAG: DUF1622 domain-containing protein [Methanomicrobiales archaeon]|nr:DUF1622 domain-containing protein [Methanomicrobiales archaeon]